MEAGAIGLAAAFAAGLVSFVSPCVLPMVPAYVSYVAGQPLRGGTRHASAHDRFAALGLSLFFVLGFSAVFVTLGASASALGRLLLQYRYESNLVGGAIVIVFGLAMLGMTSRVPWLYRDFRFHPRLAGGRPLPAFILGVAFGFGWTPCIGPILGAILTLSAVQTSGLGVGLLATYAAGLGVPFLVAALFTRELAGRLKPLRRIGAALQIAAGLIMVLMGIAMITGQLSAFGFWLLRTFPVFGRIG
ncbi:MAG: cytochrome C biogenesis protein [Betaproteobacteria bacterium RIFCSPLOWO2_02_FULL_65_24]|nr:MAG: cytochrome C biogenesis protein [Betaproteobacteria bacterium RIFCSPLOWO2_02_FULL_65_24]OGA93237.1 MAG: cytochrome C biogenesis protein [Betaproteobacteria bacterium RIFCSPLOWO2_12_FULL_66_14]